MNKEIDFGFRIEPFSSCSFLAKEPFYFSKPREIDKFDARDDVRIPAGKEAAGVWVFNRVQSLTNTIAWMFANAPQIITRIDIRDLKRDALVVDLAYGEVASVAIRYYDASATDAGDHQFVKSLTVADDLIDIWSGDYWVSKKRLGLLELDDIMHAAEIGNYSPPSEHASVAPSLEIKKPAKPALNWLLPPLPSGEIGKRLGVKISGMGQSLDPERIFREALLRRSFYEAEVTSTGKSFWKIHKLDAWVEYGRRMRRIACLDYAYAELPNGAVAPFHERLGKVDAIARRARYERKTRELNLSKM